MPCNSAGAAAAGPVGVNFESQTTKVELVAEISDDHQMMMEREAAGQGVPEEEEFTEYKAESVKNRA